MGTERQHEKKGERKKRKRKEEKRLCTHPNFHPSPVPKDSLPRLDGHDPRVWLLLLLTVRKRYARDAGYGHRHGYGHRWGHGTGEGVVARAEHARAVGVPVDTYAVALRAGRWRASAPSCTGVRMGVRVVSAGGGARPSTCVRV